MRCNNICGQLWNFVEIKFQWNKDSTIEIKFHSRNERNANKDHNENKDLQWK